MIEYIEKWKNCQSDSLRAKLQTELKDGETQIFICQKLLDEENVKVGVSPGVCELCDDDNYNYRKIESIGNLIRDMTYDDITITITFAKRLVVLAGEDYVREYLLTLAEEGQHTLEYLTRIADELGF